MLLPPDLREWVPADHRVHFICAFRRENRPLVARSLAPVLELAVRCRVLQVGAITVALDGTQVLACASRHAAVS